MTDMHYKDEDTNEPRRRSSQGDKRFWLKLGGAILGGIAVIGLILHLMVFPNTTISAGEQAQRDANNAASTAWGKLDQCVVATERAAQGAGAASEAVAKIYRDAVGGRYNKDDKLDQQKVFSLLQEQYPNLQGIEQLFANAMATMIGCQKEFNAAQQYMNTLANELEAWPHTSWFARTYVEPGQFPNERLHVIVGGKTLATGVEALKMMQNTIVEVDVAGTIQGGTRTGNAGASHDPFKPGGGTSPAPTPVPSKK